MPLTSAQSGVGSAALWIGLMIVLVVVGAVFLFALRRRLLNDDAPADPAGLSLHDLRQMHQRGDISAEELEAAKRIILGSAADRAHQPSRNPITGRPRDGGTPPGRAG